MNFPLGKKIIMAFEDNDMSDDEPFHGRRVRQYAADNNGPFVVHIRSIKIPLESRRITKFIREKYQSNIVMRQVNEFKMRVEFSEKIDSATKQVQVSKDKAREEANDLPTRAEWKKYRVYIPEKDVEVIGCIKYSVSQDVEELISAEGKFKNPLLPPIKILEASRFFTKTNEVNKDGAEKIQPTNDVRVTFSGLIIPDFINIDQLLIPVRKFHKKQMFCTACKRYNHTEKFCNNKKIDSTLSFSNCIHCKVDDHQTGDKSCPRRKQLEKKENSKIKKIHKKTFAEMLQQYDPEATMPGEKYREQHFPLQLGTKRQRKIEQTNYEIPSTSKESPYRKKARNDNSTTAHESPPGFRNPNQDEIEFEQQVDTFIRDFVNGMEVPPFVMRLIESFVIPTISRVIINFINSIKVKFGISL